MKTKKYVDQIVTVTDDEISAAILALMEQHKLVTEGAGATAVAAAMFNKVDIEGKNVVCILSGGNIDVTILSRVIKRGLSMTGRTCQLLIELVESCTLVTCCSVCGNSNTILFEFELFIASIMSLASSRFIYTNSALSSP